MKRSRCFASTTTPNGWTVVVVAAFSALVTAAAHDNLVYTSLDQKLALLDFFNATGGAQWLQSNGWNSSSDPCSDGWFGVVCCSPGSQRGSAWSKLKQCDSTWRGRTGSSCPKDFVNHARRARAPPAADERLALNIEAALTICAIELPSNQLKGWIPDSFAALHSLQDLDLAENTLHGPLPRALSEMGQLRQVDLFSNYLSGNLPPFSQSNASLEFVDLSANAFSGQIPGAWSNFKAVQEVYINNNALTGELSGWFGAMGSLEGLDVSSNMLHGEIPSSLCSASAVVVLSVYNNSLTGGIPSSIGQLSNIVQLDAGSNKLNGSIPDTISSLVQLQGLFLDFNMLSGVLPDGLGALVQLEQLSLAANNLQGNLPTTISNCTELRVLNLNSNLFSGSLPLSWSGLAGLRQLNVAHNFVTGVVPASVLRSWRQMRFLDIADNLLYGSIPAQISQLVHLETLYLDTNSWTGPIPEELCLLTKLTAVTLSDTSLSGPIPPCIGRLAALQVLDVSESLINGTLPVSMANLTQLTYLGLERNVMHGDPLTHICHLRNLRNLYLMDNFFSGRLDPCIGQLRQLRDLLVSGNRFQGVIPQQLMQLRDLQKFDAQRNFLSGQLPGGWADLPALTFLSVAGNGLNGTLPDDIGGASMLEVLDVSSNFISGTVPLSVCSLTRLSSLFLDANQLGGTIPACLQDTASLVVLALSRNNFQGSVPQGFWSLPVLQVLSVGENPALAGPVSPSEQLKFNLPQLYQLDLSDTALSGHIMSDLHGMPRLQSLNLQRARFSGPLDTMLAMHCPHLRVLAIDENSFSGTIPALPSSLQTALIAKNDFSGGLPSLGGLANLTYFFADANPGLTAPPPDDMWGLAKLRVFSAPYCSLHGNLPRSLLQLGVWSNSSLVNITLQGNTLHGQLPELIMTADASKVGALAYQDNDHDTDRYSSGDAPYTDDQSSDSAQPSPAPGLGQPSLQLLDLSSNHLWGEIPPSWQLLGGTPLTSLKLQLNFLSGSLAPLAGLTNLTELLVLEGSVFSCWSRRWHPFMGRVQHLPDSVQRLDPEASSYQCAWTSWAAPWTAVVLLVATLAAAWLISAQLHSKMCFAYRLCKSPVGGRPVQCSGQQCAACGVRLRSALTSLQQLLHQNPSSSLGVAIFVFFGCVMLPSYTAATSLFSDPAEYRYTMVGVTRLPVVWFGGLFFALMSFLWAFAVHQSGSLQGCRRWGCCVEPRCVLPTSGAAGEAARLLGTPSRSYSGAVDKGPATNGREQTPSLITSSAVDTELQSSVSPPSAQAEAAAELTSAGSQSEPHPPQVWQLRAAIQGVMLAVFVLLAAAGDLVLVLVQNNYHDWQQHLSGAVEYVEVFAAVYRVVLFTIALPFAVVALDACALDGVEASRQAAELAAFELPPRRRPRIASYQEEAQAVQVYTKITHSFGGAQPSDGMHSSRTFVLCILLFKLAIIPLGVLLIRSEACYADFMPWVPAPTDTVRWQYEVCIVLEPVVQQTNESFALCHNDPSLKAIVSREVQVSPPLRWQFSCASAGISLFGPQMALTLAIQGVVYLMLAVVRRSCAGHTAKRLARASGVACIRETPFVCRQTTGPWHDMAPYLRRRIAMFHATQRAAIVVASVLYGVGYPLAGMAGGVALTAQATAQEMLRPGMPQNAKILPKWAVMALPMLFSGAIWFLFGPISLIADSEWPTLGPLLWGLAGVSTTAGLATLCVEYRQR